MKKIQILLIFIIVVAASGYLVYREGSLPVNKTDVTEEVFFIASGASLNTITNNLSNAGLIRNKLVFYLIVKQLGIEKNIQAGEFNLSPSMDAYTIAESLKEGKPANSRVTIIEGLRKEEIAEIFSQKYQIPENEFTSLADEGYLFPDTYDIPSGATAEQIITIFKNNFDKKYSELESAAESRNLTQDQVVTLASMIEREARTDEDKQEVANILLKRLREGWHLNIDATIQYELGYQPGAKRWWKEALSFADLEIDSPYNTYKVIGLPPGPICNPGMASLSAAANADDSTPYWYYVSDVNGKLHYATTLDEHNANIERYL